MESSSGEYVAGHRATPLAAVPVEDVEEKPNTKFAASFCESQELNDTHVDSVPLEELNKTPNMSGDAIVIPDSLPDAPEPEVPDNQLGLSQTQPATSHEILPGEAKPTPATPTKALSEEGGKEHMLSQEIPLGFSPGETRRSSPVPVKKDDDKFDKYYHMNLICTDLQV